MHHRANRHNQSFKTMQKIDLTRNEKQTLRLLAAGLWCPDTMPYHRFAAGCIGLERKGLAKCAWASGHELADAHITTEGEIYLAINPTLRNPIEWKWIITTIITFGAFIVSVVALLTACRALNQI